MTCMSLSCEIQVCMSCMHMHGFFGVQDRLCGQLHSGLSESRLRWAWNPCCCHCCGKKCWRCKRSQCCGRASARLRGMHSPLLLSFQAALKGTLTIKPEMPSMHYCTMQGTGTISDLVAGLDWVGRVAKPPGTTHTHCKPLHDSH